MADEKTTGHKVEIITPSSISLPNSEKLLLQLAAKLVEYEGRNQEGVSPYQAPDSPKAVEAHFDLLKEIILGTLLFEGEVDLEEIKQKITAKVVPHARAEDIEEVFQIIANYCKNGGEDNYYGTGLPAVAAAIDSQDLAVDSKDQAWRGRVIAARDHVDQLEREGRSE